MSKIENGIVSSHDSEFDHSQTEISSIIYQILNTTDDQEINEQTASLIVVVKAHLNNKKSCCYEHSSDNSACLKRIVVEESGLNLIENTLKNEHTSEALQQVVRGWFRDSFWMIEAECLRCGK